MERVISATYADWKNVKTRGVVQLVFEVPVEKTEEVLKMLGAPIPGREQWVAIAVMSKSVPDRNSSDADKAAYTDTTQRESGKRWADLSRAQRAGILCADPQFQAWANMPDGDTTAAWLRSSCRVASRSELDSDADARAIFDGIVFAFRTDTGQETERR